MVASVITVSPRVPVAKLEQIARGRILRDGGVELAVTTADARQVAHLRRVVRRLAADPALQCHLKDRTDGATYLTAFPAGKPPVGWMGEPRTG
jgi:hypothetical protein